MRARSLAAIAAAACMLVAAVSCSLDLDESLLEPRDAGFEAEPEPVEAGAEDVLPPPPEGGTCTRDEDCKTSHGCLQGRCDLGRGVCAYDVCKTPACNSAACDTTTQQCGAPQPYRYRAGSFAVGGTVCPRCVAAVHPWLVVLTATGPVAFNVSDPQSSSPPRVPVVGLGFYPTQLVQSGSRVFFLGQNQGLPDETRLPIAWIDMPADPFATQLEATSVLATYNRPQETTTAYSKEGDGLILSGAAAASYPSSIVQPPLTEPLTITATPITFTAGFAPVAVSGSRLVLRQNANGTVSFGLIDAVGTATPGTQQDVVVADAGLVSGSETFAQLPGGAVFYLTNSITAPPSPGPSQARALRGYFLIADGTAAPEGSVAVDVEVYDVGTPPPPGSAFAGPTAMLDPGNVLVTGAARENLAQTSVQFVRREPLGLVSEDGGTKRTVLPIAISTIVGAAASNGIGYVVANDVVNDATVYVFDPRCPL